ncbi:uncharacterized protein BX664DRAFT_329799 [Halteromyces radiatus]|uniref:uncharacterized protein n=1 Tax=Halteromyces radiatus TaxID=101107 RepID=UPI00221EC1E7|nr:uncharacterized protein BX664DRAFT_329799 [Halteromyces radiatus]KAI8093479.1 hypothetical protein BX664DRAFT_329799 [Halteromyces radiatus]
MAYYSAHDNDFRQGPSNHYAPPPPLPQHYDTYAMNDVHSHQEKDYYEPDQMYSAYQNKTPMTQPQGYQYLDDPYHQPDPYDYDEKKRRSCCDILCCGCCTCCPRWARYCSCVFLLLIIALGIVIGVLAAIFKKPSIDFGGIQGEPQFNLTGTTANIAFNVNFTVNNPNIESVTFKNIEAKVYYPNVNGLDLSHYSIGGGNKSDVHISSNANTTIMFPLSLQLDAASENTRAILSDITQKCGIGGGTPQDITINYDIIPNINIIGIPITFTVSSHSSFACPSSIANGMNGILGTLGSLLGSGTLPSGGLNSLTSLLGSNGIPLPTGL